MRAGEWRLLTDVDGSSRSILGRLDGLLSGTGVLLRRMDRVVGDSNVEDSKAKDRFLQTAEQVERHLAVTFHRFLARPRCSQFTLAKVKSRLRDPFLHIPSVYARHWSRMWSV